MKQKLQSAAKMCQLVNQSDLLCWLDLTEDSTAEAATSALKIKRSKMQSMQHNPKFKEAAKFLIKNYRTLLAVLEDPAQYRKAVELAAAQAQIPMLVLAIDSVLADGFISPEEELFLRKSANDMGIPQELYKQTVTDRCDQKGVSTPDFSLIAPPEIASMQGTNIFQLPTSPKKRFEGAGWWDARFSDLLLSHIPNEPQRVVDLSCGLGWAALAILPDRPTVEYLGIDTDQRQIDAALTAISQANLQSRAVVQRREPTNLPLPDNTVDLVLCLMSLRKFNDTKPIFEEIFRLLRPGGKVIIVEPDALGQQFYFDGNLIAYNDIFCDLVQLVDKTYAAKNPDPLGCPGVSLGPVVGQRMRAAGIKPVHTVVHLVQAVTRCRFSSFAKRLRARTRAMAVSAGLPERHPLLLEASSVVAELEQVERQGAGTGAHLLPLFMVIGEKPEI